MHKPWATLSLIVFVSIVVVLLIGYSRNEVQRANDIAAAVRATGGNPHHGKDKIKYYGCSSCHTIPGIREANGKVGPPLTAFALRIYIAAKCRTPLATCCTGLGIHIRLSSIPQCQRWG